MLQLNQINSFTNKKRNFEWTHGINYTELSIYQRKRLHPVRALVKIISNISATRSPRHIPAILQHVATQLNDSVKQIYYEKGYVVNNYNDGSVAEYTGLASMNVS